MKATALKGDEAPAHVKPAAPQPPADPEVGRITRARDGRVFLIGLDRPTKLNGFTPEMCRELAYANTEFENDPEARCALLFSHGPHFTAGLDLPRMQKVIREPGAFCPEGCVDPFDFLEPRRAKPLVTAMEGITFTIGLELMLAGDVGIAAADCRFAQLEAKRGIMATGGATLRMVRRAGWGNAMLFLLSGCEFDADTALRCGLVQEVTPPGQAYGRARAIAEEIADAAPLAVRAMRANADMALQEGWDRAIADLGPQQHKLLQTSDAAEGVRSFREKRPARFTGS